MRKQAITAVMMIAMGTCAMGQATQPTRQPATRQSAATKQEAKNAIAVLQPLGNSNVHGTVRFTQEADGVRIVADVEGLPPNTTRGFHIHEYGDCSSPDGTSAGGHYNPEQVPHAGPDASRHHAGDMGNIKSDDTGHAKLDMVMHGITINGAGNPIAGRSIVLHAEADDLKSQPTGNAGARVACGVIGVAKGE